MKRDLSSTFLAHAALGMLSDLDNGSRDPVSAPKKHPRAFCLPSGISWDRRGLARALWEIMGRGWEFTPEIRITGA